MSEPALLARALWSAMTAPRLPIDFLCTTCGAEPGIMCVSLGKMQTPQGVTISNFHQARRVIAWTVPTTRQP